MNQSTSTPPTPGWNAGYFTGLLAAHDWIKEHYPQDLLKWAEAQGLSDPAKKLQQMSDPAERRRLLFIKD